MLRRNFDKDLNLEWRTFSFLMLQNCLLEIFFRFLNFFIWTT